jgi:nucleoside-diphosphate-sugar epimerase
MAETGPVLVTGAAGQLGAVGRTVTGLLLDRALPVRALVRREDDRAAALRAAGAEVVGGDLLADPWEPVLTYVSPSPSRPALALAGPACRGHPGNAPAGLTARSGRGRETGFAPPGIVWRSLRVQPKE